MTDELIHFSSKNFWKSVTSYLWDSEILGYIERFLYMNNFDAHIVFYFIYYVFGKNQYLLR